MLLDRVPGFRLDAGADHRDGRSHRPAFCRLRVGNSQVSSASPMRRLVGSHDEPVSLMPSLAVQTSGGCVYVDGSPWHGCWSTHRKGGSAMRKVMESLMLLLARIRKVITGQR